MNALTPHTAANLASADGWLTSPLPVSGGAFIPQSLSAQGSAQGLSSLNYAASNLPQADAAAFHSLTKQGWRCVPVLDTEPTRTAITSGNPDDAVRGFSAMMARVRVETAAVEHDRLCEASADRFGYSGVTGLRKARGDALRKRMRAELDAGKVT